MSPCVDVFILPSGGPIRGSSSPRRSFAIRPGRRGCRSGGVAYLGLSSSVPGCQSVILWHCRRRSSRGHPHHPLCMMRVVPGGVGNAATMITHLGGLVIVDAGTLAVSSYHCGVRSGLVVLFVGSAYLVLMGLSGILGGGLLTHGSPTRSSGPAWVRSWDPGGARSFGLVGRGDPLTGSIPGTEWSALGSRIWSGSLSSPHIHRFGGGWAGVVCGS